MANKFVNVPVPASNAAGAAVDVSAMGQTKTLVCGGSFDATVNVEFATDDTGTDWAPLATFQGGPGNKTVDVAAHWLRVVTSAYKSGAPNVDVGSSGAASVFAQIPSPPPGGGIGATVTIDSFPLFKSVVLSGGFDGTVNIEVSEDGTSWAQVMTFHGGGGKSGAFYAKLARARSDGPSPTIWIGAANEGVGSSNGQGGFDLTANVVYARTTGSDATGTGTLANPYRTFVRAIQDLPKPGLLNPGEIWSVDISGDLVTGVFDEQLPNSFALPEWKSPMTFGLNFADDFYFFLFAAVNIRATPMQVPMTPQSDAVIELADVLSVTAHPVTGQITITLVAGRPATWGAIDFKGRLLVGANGIPEPACIVSNTADSITLTTPDLPTYPLQIMQPSAHLHGPSPAFPVFNAGALTCINVDSIAFNGIKITSDDGGIGLFTDGAGIVALQRCELESPFFFGTCGFQSKLLTPYIYGYPQIGWSSFSCFQGLMDGTAGASFCTAPPTDLGAFRNMVFLDCDPIEVNDTSVPFLPAQPCATPFLSISNTRIVRSTGDGVVFHGTNGLLQNVDIEDCVGNAITANQGSGYLKLENVRSSSPNGGFGIQVDDGIQIRVDAATSAPATVDNAPVSGVGGDMKVGDLAARQWADFLANPPVKNTYDITAVGAAGATGTGSRVSQP